MQYQKTFGKPIQGFGLFGYDAAKDRPSRKQVENATRQVNTVGLVSGRVQCNAAGDRRNAKMYIMKVAQGKVRLETTLDVKTR